MFLFSLILFTFIIIFFTYSRDFWKESSNVSKWVSVIIIFVLLALSGFIAFFSQNFKDNTLLEKCKNLKEYNNCIVTKEELKYILENSNLNKI